MSKRLVLDWRWRWCLSAALSLARRRIVAACLTLACLHACRVASRLPLIEFPQAGGDFQGAYSYGPRAPAIMGNTGL